MVHLEGSLYCLDSGGTGPLLAWTMTNSLAMFVLTTALGYIKEPVTVKVSYITNLETTIAMAVLHPQ
jgi:hypothetical protein